MHGKLHSSCCLLQDLALTFALEECIAHNSLSYSAALLRHTAPTCPRLRTLALCGQPNDFMPRAHTFDIPAVAVVRVSALTSLMVHDTSLVLADVAHDLAALAQLQVLRLAGSCATFSSEAVTNELSALSNLHTLQVSVFFPILPNSCCTCNVQL